MTLLPMVQPRSCNGCRFCCWAYGIGDLDKKPLKSCIYECSSGCSVHSTPVQPKECKDFNCPYILGKDIHRPDTFEALLKELGSSLGCFIPHVPTFVPVDAAQDLIKRTRTVPAALQCDTGWEVAVLSIDQASFQELSGLPNTEWNELYERSRTQ